MPLFLGHVLLALALLAQDDEVSDAVSALQSGNIQAAEQILRAELKTRPQNPDALAVLAVVLDQEKKYSEADSIYAQALTVWPRSPALLNNYGNHLLAEGKPEEARTAFRQVLQLDPEQVNACAQLAALALKSKSSADTACLDRLSESARRTIDPKLSFSLGVALAGAGQYGKAESYFAHAAQADPGNFEALYDLGLAASHAEHKQRARDALTQALDRQPANVDVLYDLAAIDSELGQKDTALELLSRAARLSPDRADVQRLMAHTSADLGDFADAAEAWKRYMILQPGDAIGFREHAFAEAAWGENANASIADLESYVHSHPSDAIGHYELGTAESASNPEVALNELNRALTLKPELTAAHVARGLLNYRQGHAAAALTDFEFAAQHEPGNARILDRLGETYTAVNRPADALRAFREAAKLAPNDSSILLHFGRALISAGQNDEAKPVFARLRELGPNRSTLPHPAGLVDFLSLSPQEQYARYRAGVERTVAKNPDNVEAQVRYLGLLLDDGKADQAGALAQKILALKPSPTLLAEAADMLLSSERYSIAYDFLQGAVALAGTPPALKLDFAIASFHVEGARQALQQLDQIFQPDRNGDYYLARAQVLDALNDNAYAETALKQALAAKPTRPELYRQMALLLIKKDQDIDALRLLDLGTRLLPNDPDIPLLKTIAAESKSQRQNSEPLLQEFATRWPESYRIWSQNP